MPARYRVYFWMGPLIVVSWLSLVLIDPDPPGANHIPLGYFLGSLFAHVTLSAVWIALGPGRLLYRVPLSILWVLSLLVVVGLNVSLHGGPPVWYMVGGCLVAQWVMLQIPLWAMAIGLQLQLRHQEVMPADGDGHQFRFGIRHLLIMMTIVSVLLGAGRLVVPHINLTSQGELPVFLFLVVAAIILTLPLLLAALMRRLALAGVLLSLLLIGLATAWELPLLHSLGGSGPDKEHLIAINFASSALILVFALVVRWNGYRLDMLPRSPAKELG